MLDSPAFFFVAKWRKFASKKTLVRSSFQARFKRKKKVYWRRCHLVVVVRAFSSRFPLLRMSKKKFSFCAYFVACNEDNALISYLTLFVELCCLSIFYCVLLVSFIASLLCYAYWQAFSLLCWEFYQLLVVCLWWVSSSPYCELCHLLVVSFIIFLICVLGEFCHLWIYFYYVFTKLFNTSFSSFFFCPF